MRASIVFLPFVLAFAGCMSSAPKAPKNWTVECAAACAEAAGKPSLPVVKLLQLEVRAPYSGSRIAVVRRDGSLAFDAFNSFAAQPASLLRGAAQDALESSGKFERVLTGGSSALAPMAAEVTVTKLALECGEAGRCDAAVALTLALVDSRSRSVVSVSKGESAVAAADGNYTAAFSRAFASAMSGAVRGIEAK